MMTAAMILATLLFQNQEDLPARAKPLIEKLRSDKIEERDEAMRELKKLGRDALPLLRRIAQDPDLEVAGRVQAAIRAIDLREKLKAEARDTGTVEATSVVEWMTAESGRRILCAEDMGLRNRRIRVSAEGLDAGGAYEVGVDLLKTVEIATIPEGDDPRRVVLVPAPIASKKGLKVYTSIDALPRANEFCSLVVTVRHLSPRDIQAVLINVISYPQNCLSIESSGKLLLSDYASTLRSLSRLVDQLDAPRPPQTCRISVALLAGTADAAASIPEPFRPLRLPEATGRNRFAIVGEGFARVENPPPAPGVRSPSGSGVAVRFAAERPYLVEAEGAFVQASGILIDRLLFRSDAEADRKASPLLQTRLHLKKGEWTVAGAVPGEKEGTILVLLVRGDPE